MRIVLGLLLAAAGCFGVEYPDGVIACGEAGCPPGYQCATDGTCRRSQLPPDGGADAPVAVVDGAPGDAGADGGGPELTCSALAMLADDFDDGMFGHQWSRSYGTVTSRLEQNGMAEFPVEPQTWSAYGSSYDYDLTGGVAAVRVVDVGVGPAIYTFLGVQQSISGPDPVARIIHYEGEIYAETKIDGVSDAYGTKLTYDPALHRFWRIRESAGTLYWQVSADGVDWTDLASRELWFDARYVQVHFGLGTDTTAPPATTARFDDLNGGVATGEACPASSVTDDFGDPAATQVEFSSWSSGQCTSAIDTGAATIDLSGTAYGECSWTTRRGLDLTGGHASIEVEEGPAATSEYAYLGIERPNRDRVQIITWEGSLYASTRINGEVTNAFQVPYDPALHRYWRLGVAGGRLYAEVSAAGVSWESTDMGTPFPLDEIQVYFGAGVAAATGQPASARFDDFNILP